MHAERIGKRGVWQLFDRREPILQQRDLLNPFHREGSDFLVLGHVGQQVQAAQRMREPIRVHQVRLGSLTRARVIRDRRLPPMQGGFERAGNDLLPASVGRLVHRPAVHRIRLGRDDMRQLVEKLPHMRCQPRGQLVERAFDVFSKRRAGQRLHERPAEVQGAEL